MTSILLISYTCNLNSGKKRDSINFLEDFLTSAGGKQKKFDTIASSHE